MENSIHSESKMFPSSMHDDDDKLSVNLNDKDFENNIENQTKKKSKKRQRPQKPLGFAACKENFSACYFHLVDELKRKKEKLESTKLLIPKIETDIQIMESQLACLEKINSTISEFK